jgi:hypothetical protein
VDGHANGQNCFFAINHDSDGQSCCAICFDVVISQDDITMISVYVHLIVSVFNVSVSVLYQNNWRKTDLRGKKPVPMMILAQVGVTDGTRIFQY